jgi:hypothetical protein
MPDTTPMGADIVIYEDHSSYYDDPVQGAKAATEVACIKPRRVRVNGTDVGLIFKDSLSVDVGDGNYTPVKVTLTLLAKSVTIRAE